MPCWSGEPTVAILPEVTLSYGIDLKICHWRGLTWLSEALDTGKTTHRFRLARILNTIRMIRVHTLVCQSDPRPMEDATWERCVHRLLLQLVCFMVPLAQMAMAIIFFHPHGTHLQRWGADGVALDHEHVAGGDLLQVLVMLGIQVNDIRKPILLGRELRFEDLYTSTNQYCWRPSTYFLTSTL